MLSSKGIIDIIKDREVLLFQEDFNSIKTRAEKINKEGIYGIFIYFKFKDLDINRMNEVLSNFKSQKGKKIQLKIGARTTDKEDKILLFVSYKKEGGENG